MGEIKYGVIIVSSLTLQFRLIYVPSSLTLPSSLRSSSFFVLPSFFALPKGVAFIALTGVKVLYAEINVVTAVVRDFYCGHVSWLG